MSTKVSEGNEIMEKTFNIYCDESTHLQNDKMPYMIISYVSTAYNQLKQHNQHIKFLKTKYKIKGEIKWTKVSKSKYPFYNELIEYFFASELAFRAVIVDKSKINEDIEEFTYNDFYFRMYYQLLFHKMEPSINYNIYVDIKDTNSHIKLLKLKNILSKRKKIRNIQFIKSYESYLMQMTDVLMGALNYNLRKRDKVEAKRNLVKKIELYTKLTLVESTEKTEDKFNLFFIELK